MKTIKQINFFVLFITFMFIPKSNSAQGSNAKLSLVDFDNTSIKKDVNEQTAIKTKILCYTVSCCSIGPITVEVWSETTCYYVSAGKSSKPMLKTTFYFTEKPPKSGYIEIKESIIIAGLKDKKGNLFILPKGKYKLDKTNSIIYTPSIVSPATSKVQKYCISKTVDGTIFGHHYHYSVKICISYSTAKGAGGYYTPDVLDLKLNAEQLKKVKEGEEFFILNEDVKISIKGVHRIIKAGKYQIAKDGKVYFYN